MSLRELNQYIAVKKYGVATGERLLKQDNYVNCTLHAALVDAPQNADAECLVTSEGRIYLFKDWSSERKRKFCQLNQHESMGTTFLETYELYQLLHPRCKDVTLLEQSMDRNMELQNKYGKK